MNWATKLYDQSDFSTFQNQIHDSAQDDGRARARFQDLRDELQKLGGDSRHDERPIQREWSGA